MRKLPKFYSKSEQKKAAMIRDCEVVLYLSPRLKEALFQLDEGSLTDLRNELCEFADNIEASEEDKNVRLANLQEELADAYSAAEASHERAAMLEDQLLHVQNVFQSVNVTTKDVLQKHGRLLEALEDEEEDEYSADCDDCEYDDDDDDDGFLAL